MNNCVLVHNVVVTEAGLNHLVALAESNREFGLTGSSLRARGHPIENRVFAC